MTRLEINLANAIPDGIYYLHPEGSCWLVAIFRDGVCVGESSKDVQSTHDAAGDSLSGLAPSDDDDECDGDLSVAIIRDVMGEIHHPEMVIVQAAHVPAEACNEIDKME